MAMHKRVWNALGATQSRGRREHNETRVLAQVFTAEDSKYNACTPTCTFVINAFNIKPVWTIALWDAKFSNMHLHYPMILGSSINRTVHFNYLRSCLTADPRDPNPLCVCRPHSFWPTKQCNCITTASNNQPVDQSMLSSRAAQHLSPINQRRNFAPEYYRGRDV